MVTQGVSDLHAVAEALRPVIPSGPSFSADSWADATDNEKDLFLVPKISLHILRAVNTHQRSFVIGSSESARRASQGSDSTPAAAVPVYSFCSNRKGTRKGCFWTCMYGLSLPG